MLEILSRKTNLSQLSKMQHWQTKFWELFSLSTLSHISVIYLMVFLIFYFYFEEILPYFYLPLLDTKLPEDKDFVLAFNS